MNINLIRSVGNAHAITALEKLLHGKEKRCWADAGYQGAAKREELSDRTIDWHIAARPSKRKQKCELGQRIEYLMASVRAKVEHPFRIIKQQFGYMKIRYKGLEKNHNRLEVLATFSNLSMCKRHLLR